MLNDSPPPDPRALIRYALAGLALTVIVLWAAFLVRDALLVIYISLLVAIGLSPLVAALAQHRPRRQRLPRWAAILIIYSVIVGTIIGIGMMIFPPLVEQARELWKELPNQLHRAQLWLLQRGWISRELTVQEAVKQTPVGGSDAVGTVVTAVWGLVGGIFGVITILILTFYLLIEAGAMFEYLVRFVPRGRRADLATAARQGVAKVSAWLRAQFILAGVMGTFAAIGLGLLGVPYFYVIALIAAIGETIPIVGPVIGGVTAVAVALTVSPKLALIVGVYFLVLHQLEANVLVPKIMERSVGVSPVAVLVALLVGGALMGLAGAILAIPTAALLSVIIEEIAADREARIQRIK